MIKQWLNLEKKNGFYTHTIQHIINLKQSKLSQVQSKMQSVVQLSITKP